MSFLCFIIALCATLVGSLTGLGGGVIIKPAMDLFAGAQLTLAQISILSSATVLSMAVYSTAKGIRSKVVLPVKQLIPLGIAAGVGGFIGEFLFRSAVTAFGEDVCGNVQTISLMSLIAMVLVLYCIKARLHPLAIQNVVLICLIGFFLGTISSFLGIGGGPINVIMLSLLLSFDDKQCVFGSLFIIIFAQLIKLGAVVFGGRFLIPPATLLLMICGGVLGGMVGSRLTLKVSDQMVRSAFKVAMVGIILLNVVILLR